MVYQICSCSQGCIACSCWPRRRGQVPRVSPGQRGARAPSTELPLEYDNTVNEDGTTTTSEICCVCQTGEITYPGGSVCPSTCVQRPEPGGCTLEESREYISPPRQPGIQTVIAKLMCCICARKEGGTDEISLPRAAFCRKDVSRKAKARDLDRSTTAKATGRAKSK